jgi:hypothetical protein
VGHAFGPDSPEARAISLANGMVRRWAYCGADVYSPEEEASDGNTHDRN